MQRLLGRWTWGVGSHTPGSGSAAPDLDPAEEFQSIQRGLRRLSLASDRSGQMLEAVAVRVDEVQQLIIEGGRQPEVALALDEADLLDLLDRLDRMAELPDLPRLARSLLAEMTDALLAMARWRPVARAGSRPEGSDIRIAEYLGEATLAGTPDVRIFRVLEQGYRRADGTLLRPGVVVASATGTDPA